MTAQAESQVESPDAFGELLSIVDDLKARLKNLEHQVIEERRKITSAMRVVEVPPRAKARLSGIRLYHGGKETCAKRILDFLFDSHESGKWFICRELVDVLGSRSGVARAVHNLREVNLLKERKRSVKCGMPPFEYQLDLDVWTILQSEKQTQSLAAKREVRDLLPKRKRLRSSDGLGDDRHRKVPTTKRTPKTDKRKTAKCEPKIKTLQEFSYGLPPTEVLTSDRLSRQDSVAFVLGFEGFASVNLIARRVRSVPSVVVSALNAMESLGEVDDDSGSWSLLACDPCSMDSFQHQPRHVRQCSEVLRQDSVSLSYLEMALNLDKIDVCKVVGRLIRLGRARMSKGSVAWIDGAENKTKKIK